MIRMRKKFIICIYLLLWFSHLFCEHVDIPDLDQWFKEQPDAASYLSIKEDLSFLFSEARARNLPLSLLYERLREGISKHVPPQRLLKALEFDVEQLSRIVEMMKVVDALSFSRREIHFFIKEGIQWDVLNREQNTPVFDLIHQLSLLNRSGISIESMSNLFTCAIENEKSINTMLPVLHSLIKIPGLDNLKERETVDLGKALIKSALSPDSYGTLSSIFVKGRIYHLNYSTISDIVVKVLNRGGGIVQIEQEIIQRGRKR
jgi:hypothetical protein